MLFNSVQFLLFFPIVVLVYFLITDRFKYLWLLFASYFFYMSWNPRYGLLLFGSTAVTYAGGRLIERYRMRELRIGGITVPLRKLLLFLTVFLNFSVLFYFKYFDFALANLYRILQAAGISAAAHHFDVLLPVGISFFTFQAVGYTIDVYRGDIYAEPNFLRYALFVSFFPQLVAGPIERSKNLLKQLHRNYSFDFENMREGLLLMLWGYFLKLMIADRAALYVDVVYSDFYTYSGIYIAVATALFAFQIYCDFAGYSIIAMGAARVLGIRLMDNFNCPYFSRSVAEFWRRWHISLSSWFRDYLYIPLGGNRRGRLRKYINLMLVFLLSGLWHGASWSFVVWGGLNGLYQIFGSITAGLRSRIAALFKIRRESFSNRLFQTVVTFILICISWIFFRADSFLTALRMGREVLTNPMPDAVFGALYQCGMEGKDFLVLMLSILILLCADCLKYRGVVVRKALLRQDFRLRWLVYVGGAMMILIFGIWGSGYDASSFIYFQF